jgi:hypothetical protein
MPGLIRHLYVHIPTTYVYENPVVTYMPLGMYSMSTGVLSLYSNRYMNAYGSGGYRPSPLENPAALGKYPGAMGFGNELAYAPPCYGISDYSNPYMQQRFGAYGHGLNGGYMGV